MSKPYKHKIRGKVKKAYRDWIVAVPHALMHSKDQRNIVSIYKCPTCGAFHLRGNETI